jgi:hypothetical protein
MLHRYRVAMVRPGREQLAGHVEVDEGYVGGVESRAQGRKTETKVIVAIAVEIKHPTGATRGSAACSAAACSSKPSRPSPSPYRSLVVNPNPTGRRSPLPSRPGRVAAVPAVHRAWRQNAATTGLPDSNG